VSFWPSSKATRVLAALYRIGWSLKRQSGSHKTLSRQGWPDFVFAFHDREEIGPTNAVAYCEAYRFETRRPVKRKAAVALNKED
jgi:predicted RNA binding protein YcfA (HicA-like mRNA interferase family)